jgi:hypothetical protein
MYLALALARRKSLFSVVCAECTEDQEILALQHANGKRQQQQQQQQQQQDRPDR